MAHITETAPDPTRVSPKVKAVGASGAVVTGALLVVAAALTAIPQAAFSSLGVWALPAAAATASAANYITGYLKRDPAREVTVVTETPAAPDPGSLVLTEDQALTELEDPDDSAVEDDSDPVARLAGQVGA